MEFLNRNFDIFRVPVLCYNKKAELYRKNCNKKYQKVKRIKINIVKIQR